VPWMFAFLTFLGLYRWVPEAKVQWSAAFWGALVASIAWEVAKRGIVWYLSSGLARYRLVYGSLATVVVLMLWIYVSAWIALFGAHLSAAVVDSNSSERYSRCPTSGRAGRNQHPRDRGWEVE
jgi:membrane protein